MPGKKSYMIRCKRNGLGTHSFHPAGEIDHGTTCNGCLMHAIGVIGIPQELFVLLWMSKIVVSTQSLLTLAALVNTLAATSCLPTSDGRSFTVKRCKYRVFTAIPDRVAPVLLANWRICNRPYENEGQPP